MKQMKRKAAVALGLGALLALGTLTPSVAGAAPQAVTDVTFAWNINDEVGGGNYFGGCNFLSAGTAGDTGSSRLWTAADGFYSNSVGNVSIEKPTATGGWVAPTWATKCQNAAGTAVTTAVGSTTDNRVVFAAGTGTRDAQTGAATIAWTGSFTIVFYGGLTYWSVANPVLTIAADGTGQLTGTASGYGADRDNPEAWSALTPTNIVLADFTGLSATATEIVATPKYQGVTYANDATPVQVTTGSTWGAFPTSFVDFNVSTGQAAYWYSSGGAADAKKATTTDGFVVSFARPAATVTASAKAVAYGTATQVTAAVTGRTGATPTGQVRLTAGAKTLATATLSAAGTTLLTVPAKALPVGTHAAMVTYLGSDTYASATTSVSIQVTKVATKVTAKAKKKKIKAKARSVVIVKAKAAGSAATGKVKVTWKGTKGKGKGVTVTATKSLKKGKAKVKSAKLKKKGTYKISVRFAGNATSTAKTVKAKAVKVR